MGTPGDGIGASVSTSVELTDQQIGVPTAAEVLGGGTHARGNEQGESQWALRKRWLDTTVRRAIFRARRRLGLVR